MKVVVLAGGISTERDVSLSSGSMIYQALKKRGHNVLLLDVYLGYEGEWEKVFEEKIDWTKQVGKIGEKNPDITEIKALRKDGGRSFFGPHVIDICQQAELVFLALHGENGENGKLQAAFDLLGIRYTGTDYVSSALCMDKGITKELFAVHHIPTPFGVKLKKGEADKRQVALPCVVKACCGGSSVGVSIAHTDEEYMKAKEEAFCYDEVVVIEAYIQGREFSVGVIEGKALPVIEIAPLQGFYDYKNKYQAGSTVETCPARLKEEQSRQMQQIARRVFEVLRLKGYARMDFMMDEQGNMFCLEANTLPGMTPTSLLPQEAAAVGMSFEDLCEKIMEIALKKESA
ncbi:MAG: D-alanine--D-alanine ligase [Lachnospiraceae bacterium]